MAKLAVSRRISTRLPPGTRVLDAGCGEGVLVEEYAGRLRIEASTTITAPRSVAADR